MARSYLFTCLRCNFSARVAGGDDNGHDCFVRTIHCLDCRNVYDVATHVRLPTAVVLTNRVGATDAAGRLARRLPGKALRPLIPQHVAFCAEVVNARPSLLEGMLVGAQDRRWVELAVACPVNVRHRIEPWAMPPVPLLRELSGSIPLAVPGLGLKHLPAYAVSPGFRLPPAPERLHRAWLRQKDVPYGTTFSQESFPRPLGV